MTKPIEDRKYSWADQLCLGLDQFLRALKDNPKTSGRMNPAGRLPESSLSLAEKKQAAGLMRVNHAGEICAQALYHGQSLASRNQLTAEKLRQAAVEEGDHLAWCSQRIVELGSHTSYLNPLWYLGSFGLGLGAGLAGDKWSLGFLAETEKQVVKHLQSHLDLLPEQDQRSLTILRQMQADEEKHQQEALELGAAALPHPVQIAMKWTAKIMVKTAYWI